MLEFKKITLDDKCAVFELLKDHTARICDITPANLVFWRDYYDISYVQTEDGYALRFGDMDGISYYAECASALTDAIIEREGGAAYFSGLTEAEVRGFTERYECDPVWHERDWDDYLYLASDIVELKGRKYCTQRNHINKFNKLYGDRYTFEEINSENKEAVKRFCYDYYHSFGREESEVDGYEEQHIYEQIDDMEDGELCTGVLRVDGEIIGFSIAEVVGDTLHIHTEKANVAYDGAYPMLVNLFARRHVTDGVVYINREEDCGEAGLRHSKLSYHPIEILAKHTLLAKPKNICEN